MKTILPTKTRRIALLGNPNVGKSTLFGRLAGSRVHTSNFPGTTQEAHISSAHGLELVDLPGVYTLQGEQSESEVCRAALAGNVPGAEERRPDAVGVVVDAANLSRNLRLVGEVMRIGLPVVVVLNRMDQAERRGVRIEVAELSEALGCEVVPTNALNGAGVEGVLPALDRAREPAPAPDDAVREWAERIVERCTEAPAAPVSERLTDRLDDLFTHPLIGTIVFAAVMTGLFWAVFKIATYPMDWIDMGFAALGDWVGALLPAGAIRSLLVEGIIGGVGATVIFLPQICLMFFLISLLEHSGYLPRAALLVDRLFRPFGLPGQSFVPLLSAHACAIPGLVATRGIPDRKERLATILVLPFMSCTARIPVYVLLTSLLFADRPALAALAFTGCYVLGAATALGTAAVLRRTLLRSRLARPMALELPGYRRPSVRQALMTTWDRGVMFLRKAGTVILGMVVALWWLGSYPITPPPPEAVELRQQAEVAPEPELAASLEEKADSLEARAAQANSFMGRIGRTVAPVFEPLGYDWQITIGVMSSFAAREVFVSTMAVVLATGEETLETEEALDRIKASTRSDGQTPVFTRPAAWSLLVFYVLAMQCLPTLAVTAREAGGWKWAGIQLGYMTALAYAGGLIAYNMAVWLG